MSRFAISYALFCVLFRATLAKLARYIEISLTVADGSTKTKKLSPHKSTRLVAKLNLKPVVHTRSYERRYRRPEERSGSLTNDAESLLRQQISVTFHASQAVKFHIVLYVYRLHTFRHSLFYVPKQSNALRGNKTILGFFVLQTEFISRNLIMVVELPRRESWY